jgi:hypothetical protein
MQGSEGGPALDLTPLFISTREIKPNVSPKDKETWGVEKRMRAPVKIHTH